MKILLLLIFATITFASQAQTYHPFPLNYGAWSYQYYDDNHLPTSLHTYDVMLGDTVISGTNYKKLYEGSYVGALRENNKIIYFYPDTASHEYVLYNFNFDLGDTIIHPFGGAACSNDTVTVTQVDSFQCLDGYHRMLWFSSQTQWLDGVGSANHLLQPFNVYCVSGDNVLTCMTGGSGEIYTNGSPTYCITSINDLSQNAIATIFPNPATNQIEIKGNDILSLTLYDVLGRIVFSNSETVVPVTINTTSFSRGIYFLQARTKGGMVARKVVLE